MISRVPASRVLPIIAQSLAASAESLNPASYDGVHRQSTPTAGGGPYLPAEAAAFGQLAGPLNGARLQSEEEVQRFLTREV